MKKHIFNLCYTLGLLFFLWGCSFTEQEANTDQLTIISWNVQNLFDGMDNGFEYAEFRKSEGWNTEKYQARLHGITAALNGENGIKADILALMEVENAAVIEDLAEKSFLDYRWTFFAGTPVYSAEAQEDPDSVLNSYIGLGVLSNLPLTETRAHSFHSSNGSIPRPIAEIWVDTEAGPLILFICHWKSKREGAEKTSSLRRDAAALITRRLSEIEREDPGIPVIILGDLNENHDEFIRIDEAYPCALLPDTAIASSLIQKTTASPRPDFYDFLVLSSQKPPRSDFFTGTMAVVFSPWLDEEPTGNWIENDSQDFGRSIRQGSYYYKESWETIDHFLLNASLFSGTSWNYRRFRVLTGYPFTNEAGLPRPYNPRTGNGLSDHLPIVLILNKP